MGKLRRSSASARSPKARRPPKPSVISPRVKRRQRTAHAAVRKDTTLLQMQPGHGELPGVTKKLRKRR